MRARTLVPVAGLGLFLSLDLLGGCATQQRLVFDKLGVTAADRQRDEDQCVRNAITQDTDGRLLTLIVIDRDAYTRCMQTRGYTMRPAR